MGTAIIAFRAAVKPRNVAPAPTFISRAKNATGARAFVTAPRTRDNLRGRRTAGDRQDGR
jgi:hypothetical protein